MSIFLKLLIFLESNYNLFKIGHLDTTVKTNTKAPIGKMI